MQIAAKLTAKIEKTIQQYLLQNLERIVTDLWITFEKVQWREEKVCRLCIDFSIVLCKTYVYACVI